MGKSFVESGKVRASIATIVLASKQSFFQRELLTGESVSVRIRKQQGLEPLLNGRVTAYLCPGKHNSANVETLVLLQIGNDSRRDKELLAVPNLVGHKICQYVRQDTIALMPIPLAFQISLRACVALQSSIQ